MKFGIHTSFIDHNVQQHWPVNTMLLPISMCREGTPLHHDYTTENVELVTKGCCNIVRHIENARRCALSPAGGLLLSDLSSMILPRCHSLRQVRDSRGHCHQPICVGHGS